MKIFISGGCKNGKSTYAQRIAKLQNKHPAPLYYIATMVASDDEDERRITAHRKERDGWGFVTIEQPRDIKGIISVCDHSGSFLLESLTALLANEMFSQKDAFDGGAYERTAGGLAEIAGKIANIVIVSDFIYSDTGQYGAFTESYRKSLAALDCLAAKKCDVVLEASYACIVFHKGRDLFSGAFGDALGAAF